MPITQHSQSLHEFAPLTRSLRSGNSLRDFDYNKGNIRRLRLTNLALRPETSKWRQVLTPEQVMRLQAQPAAKCVHGSLVCLHFLQDCGASATISGYVVRPDGIVARVVDFSTARVVDDRASHPTRTPTTLSFSSTIGHPDIPSLDVSSTSMYSVSISTFSPSKKKEVSSSSSEVDLKQENLPNLIT